MKKDLTWRQHINECVRTGVSKKAYCEQNNLSYPLFFYHQRKLMEGNLNSGFQEIVLDKSDRIENKSGDDESHALQVQFANGNTLLFSEHLLERVFELCQSSSS